MISKTYLPLTQKNTLQHTLKRFYIIETKENTVSNNGFKFYTRKKVVLVLHNFKKSKNTLAQPFLILCKKKEIPL